MKMKPYDDEIRYIVGKDRRRSRNGVGTVLRAFLLLGYFVFEILLESISYISSNFLKFFYICNTFLKVF